jgi:hypothetical protein
MSAPPKGGEIVFAACFGCAANVDIALSSTTAGWFPTETTMPISGVIDGLGFRVADGKFSVIGTPSPCVFQAVTFGG